MIKDNLILLRKVKGYSQEEIAEKTGISRQAYGKWEKGKHIFGTVAVSNHGQIVIPKQAREIFQIESGDRLVILGDEEQGLAIAKEKKFMDHMNRAMALASERIEE